MDFSSNRQPASRPAPAPAPEPEKREEKEPAPARASRPAPVKKERKSGKGKFFGFVVALLVIALVAAGVWYVFGRSGLPGLDRGREQAVFLTNGQVYFGKLSKTGDYYVLTDIYYLQQSTSDSANPQKAADENASDVQLIKLGNEVHGPEDRMVIQSEQVLFWENLKEDSKVSQSIDDYANKNK